MLRTIIKNQDKGFIRRWPAIPRVCFLSAPNSFSEQIVNRFAIDIGVPVVSINNIYREI